MPEAHQYRIVASNPGAHIFTVSVTVDSPAREGQTFAMPAWIPGSYMIRDLAQHVISINAESDGQDIPLTKTDKSTWIADVCTKPLTVTLEVYAFDRNVRGAHLDATHGFFDGACVFPAVVGQEDVPCSVEIAPPAGNVAGEWRLATSMRSEEAGAYEFGLFHADNFAELIDHPVEMGEFLVGEFEAGGIPHAIVVNGHSRFDMARLCHDLAKLCETQLQFLGKPQDLDRYLFLLDVQSDAYGGLEHRWSSSLTCSRKDLPKRGETKLSDGYRKLLGLCSHEYFHLWNVKRMKPAVFSPYDLSKEIYTRQLWVFEGITSYYDDLLLQRAGLISTQSYLELLGKAITRHLRNRGNEHQSVEESSFEAWTKFYKQHANSGNLIVSYYTKGSLVALLLDLTLRKETNGRTSLDDVMQECWRQFGSNGDGMPEGAIESVARTVSGLELEDFFERYARGTADLPMKALLGSFGIEFNVRQPSDARDSGGKRAPRDVHPPAWLGSRINSRGKFGIVRADSPAEKAGIAPGDEAVAIDGLKLSARNQDARLRDYRGGDSVVITVFRDDSLLHLRTRLRNAPADTCFLEVDDDPDAAAAGLRDGWINPAGATMD